MSRTQPRQRGRSDGSPLIHSTRLHLVLYSFLLVLTPFLFLRSYIVYLISQVSEFPLPLGPIRLPLVPTIASILLIAALLRFRRFVTRRLLLAAGIVLAMDLLAQRISDFYFSHKVYDLQQNWHYIAYGLFAFMAYRDFSPRGWPLPRILRLIFIAALAFSCFDETFQKFMSSRVFDLSDIAKDSWGSLMGLVLIVVPGRRWEELARGWSQFRREGLRRAWHNPLTTFGLMFVFDVILLSCGSLLSDFEYVLHAAGLTLLIFALLLGIGALLHRRGGRIGVAVALLAALGAIGIGALGHRDRPITRCQYGLTVYRGVPIPFFDVMIYPNGRFRLADKKHFFNKRDQDFLLKRKADIIIMGSGSRGLGARGFPESSEVQFLHNPYTGRATQVITLKTPAACELFNRLKREHRNVLFILHNTC